ncbi:unnamed protein product [Pylaiella littoralis]
MITWWVRCIEGMYEVHVLLYMYATGFYRCISAFHCHHCTPPAPPYFLFVARAGWVHHRAPHFLHSVCPTVVRGALKCFVRSMRVFTEEGGGGAVPVSAWRGKRAPREHAFVNRLTEVPSREAIHIPVCVHPE